jgi:hypothetical protein
MGAACVQLLLLFVCGMLIKSTWPDVVSVPECWGAASTSGALLLTGCWMSCLPLGSERSSESGTVIWQASEQHLPAVLQAVGCRLAGCEWIGPLNGDDGK